MAIEPGVNDLRTIKWVLIPEVKRSLSAYEARPTEKNLRGLGNVAESLGRNIIARRVDPAGEIPVGDEQEAQP